MRFYLHGRSKPERSPCRSSLPAVGICVGREETGSGTRNLALFRRHSSHRCGGYRRTCKPLLATSWVFFPPPLTPRAFVSQACLPDTPSTEMNGKEQIKMQDRQKENGGSEKGVASALTSKMRQLT